MTRVTQGEALVRTFKLTLEYDGTDFEGWQRQPEGHRTVQAVLEAALGEIEGRAVTVVAAGRTDTGVHAEGQVVGVALAGRLEGKELLRALNAKLPEDMAVRAADEVHEAFHARYDARAKHYRYEVWNGAVSSPLLRRRATRVPQPLDLDAIREAARPLVGEHDFAAFQAAGSDVKTTIRRLHALETCGASGARVWFNVHGSGFLRHMVRNLVGTLLPVGLGRKPTSWPAEVLASRDRRQAGATAAARGLTLVRVTYGPSGGQGPAKGPPGSDFPSTDQGVGEGVA